ncbi:ABC transporter substrate-binding protein [Herbiconiux flava]|uniref:Thiamine pyrimidine synthase n=1 Tax=Herbiconiux flava TaxID=881268 RepID=A0A852ST80_9MICO|nr:ABC transporter substrate-binding protein [Herbiconiux flava]NYD71972.1 NitT/TauT family transport system substrate-binding protein [Herbiconiux flava]GLK18065.1 nitrate ABC transporter substrate-binding protein [Herbiconiux flava]
MEHSTRLTRSRVIGGIGALAATAIVLTGCSSGGSSDSTDSASDGDLTPVSLQLQWFSQAQFAGYYAALDQGFYEKEGLDVTILEGATDIVPIDVLTGGDADFAISWVPKVLGSIEQGAAVTDIAQIFERSGTTQVSMKDKNITMAADLSGKTVGSWGYGNEWELFAGMNKADVKLDDISLVAQAFDMNGFLAGDIDAAQAMTYNEYAQVLETENPATGELFTPDELNVIDWNTEGTAMLQDAIWADSDRLADDADYADTAVKFIKASIEGWAYARDNPEEAANIVTASGSQLGESHQLWMTNEVNKLIWPSTSGVGTINQDQWDQTVKIAMDTPNETGATVISEEPPATAFSNEYVEKALAELKDEGVDVMGEGYTPIDVTLKEGGE